MFFKASGYPNDTEEQEREVYSDYEPVYPDGALKQECWNSTTLNLMRKTSGQKKVPYYIDDPVDAENE